MATYTCPEGHSSSADDYCDVCGAPIGGDAAAGVTPLVPPGPVASGPVASGPVASGLASGGGSALDLGLPASGALPPPLPSGLSSGPASGSKPCPNCQAENLPDALFCEDCGYDFTTGQMPRAVPATSDLAPLDPPAGAPGGPLAGPVQWVVEVWVDPDWHAVQDAADPCPSPGMPVVVPLVGGSVLVGRTSVSRNIHPQVDLSTDTGVSRRHAQLTTDGQRWWVEDLSSANGTYVSGSGSPLPTIPLTPGLRIELADDERVFLGAWTRLVVRRATPQEQAGAS